MIRVEVVKEAQYVEEKEGSSIVCGSCCLDFVYKGSNHIDCVVVRS
jgi:hypothetical protein